MDVFCIEPLWDPNNIFLGFAKWCEVTFYKIRSDEEK